MSLKDLSDFYHTEVEPQIGNWVGFLAVLSLTLFVEWNVSQTIFSENILSADHIAALSSFCFDFILTLIFWYARFRRVSKFKEDEVGILVAISKYDMRVGEEIQLLSRKIQEIIRLNNFNYSIVVKTLPERYVPLDEGEAYQIRAKFRAKLIVWGRVEKGAVNSVEQTRFSPVHFSYQVFVRPQDAPILNRVIQTVVSHRKWDISENNELIDRDYLAHNLEEVSLYIIGMVLFFAKRSDEAIEILKEVLLRYYRKNVQTAEDAIAVDNLRIAIDRVLTNMSAALRLWPGSTDTRNDLEKAKKIVVMKRECQLDGSELIEAQIEFANNRVNQCKKLLKESVRLHPTDSAAFFSLAFVAFFEGSLKDGSYYINKAVGLIKSPLGQAQLISVAVWYQQLLKEDAKKTYLHYPLGRIYMAYGDHKLAHDSFSKFSKRYRKSTDSVLRRMLQISDRKIQKLQREKR